MSKCCWTDDWMGQVWASQSTSASQWDYQCATKPHSAGKLLTHLSMGLVGARGPDLMLKLISRCGWINRARGPDLAHVPDFVDPWSRSKTAWNGGKQCAMILMYSRKQELEKQENERKAEKERQEAIERQARLNCQQEDDERRQKVLAKLEEIQQREIRENLKVITCTCLLPVKDQWCSLACYLVVIGYYYYHYCYCYYTIYYYYYYDCTTTIFVLCLTSYFYRVMQYAVQWKIMQFPSKNLWEILTLDRRPSYLEQCDMAFRSASYSAWCGQASL